MKKSGPVVSGPLLMNFTVYDKPVGLIHLGWGDQLVPHKP